MLYNRLRQKNTVCFLTVAKTNLDITMYEVGKYFEKTNK